MKHLKKFEEVEYGRGPEIFKNGHKSTIPGWHSKPSPKFYQKGLDKVKKLFSPKPQGLNLDEEGIRELISQATERELKQQLLYISKRIVTGQYITSTERISDDTIQKLKGLGFIVSVKDETNEYSDDFYETVTIGWKYTGSNYPDIDEA